MTLSGPATWFDYNGLLVLVVHSFFFLCVLILQVKTEEQIAAEQAWYGSEKVWLVHKDGFSLGEMTYLHYGAAIPALPLLWRMFQTFFFFFLWAVLLLLLKM